MADADYTYTPFHLQYSLFGNVAQSGIACPWGVSEARITISAKPPTPSL